MEIAVPHIQRLPASHAIAGHIPLYRDGHDDGELPGLTAGSPVPDAWFDACERDAQGDADTPPLAEADTPLIIEAVIDARGYAPGRWYVLIGGGWWRVDTVESARPERGDVVGEATPVANPGALPVIPASDLRVDDVMYASGERWGPRGARVLDIASARDGMLVRTRVGWFVWRRPFAHVSTY